MENISYKNLFVVVIWYNPAKEHVESLQNYINQVARIIVVDNSADNNSGLLQKYKDEICYISNGANFGVATALNIGFDKAISLGAEWVLTMDQDSRFSEKDFIRFIKLCNDYELLNATGIFSPLQVYGEEPRHGLPTYEKRIEVMTSGNIVRIGAYREAGGFCEDFFIDLVDEEFCLRVHRAAYDIIMVNAVRLSHHLGGGYTYTRFLRHKFIDHPPLRYYYIVRNTLMTMHLFPEQKYHYKRQLKKRIKRLFLYVNHKKVQKLHMAWRGFLDYRRRRMGRYEDIHSKNK